MIAKSIDEKLRIAIDVIDDYVRQYGAEMADYGSLEKTVAIACVKYLDENPNSGASSEKIEKIACSKFGCVDAYFELKKIRHDRKIYEKTIDAMMSRLSALQSLVKFKYPNV